MRYVPVTRDASRLQQALSDELIARLCRHAFGARAGPRSVQLILSGKFNTTYHVELVSGDKVILRVAPPADAPVFEHERALLRRESAVYQVLQSASGRIPRNLFEDFTGELCDRDYVFQSCLPGRLWDDVRADLCDAENEQLWVQLAPIVRSIHGICGERFGFPLPMPQFDSWGDACVQLVAGMLEDMRRFELPCEDAAIFLQFLEAGRADLDRVARPCLVHGDLWPKNILIDRLCGEPHITGVLDAERAFWGDPEAEWIFSFMDLPAGFWQRYGSLERGAAAAFRRLAYTGAGAIKLCLEASRFLFDDAPFRRILQSANRNLGA